VKAETVKFTKEVPIADADGAPIREGSVLQSVEDMDRGVVVRVVRAGDKGTAFDCVGDLNIAVSIGCTRVTNRYGKWRHIPHSEQTYQERLLSWLHRPHDHDPDYTQASKDEALAVSGIMALLPDDIVDEVYGPPADSLEGALHYLARHLSDVAGRADSKL